MTQPKKSQTKTTKKRSKARPRKTYNRDHYHRCQILVPAIVEIEARIKQWFNLGSPEKKTENLAR